jgi:hypothetical protein
MTRVELRQGAAVAARRGAPAKTTVVGPGGVTLTPGKAASALEKHIALLKRKIQQKTSGGAAAPQPSVRAAASQPSIVASTPPIGGVAVPHPPVSAATTSHPPVSATAEPHPSVSAAAVPHPSVSAPAAPHPPVGVAVVPHPPVSAAPALHPPVSAAAALHQAGSTAVAHSSVGAAAAHPLGMAATTQSSARARDEDLTVVGGKRQRSPALEMELRQSLENRRRSPATEAVKNTGGASESAIQSAVAPVAAPVPVPISAAPHAPSGSEAVFASQLRFEGRSRSPAIEADGSSGRPQPPTDLRRRSPAASVTASSAPAVAALDASSWPSENQDLEARRRLAAPVASGNAAATRPTRLEAVRTLCPAFFAMVSIDSA